MYKKRFDFSARAKLFGLALLAAAGPQVTQADDDRVANDAKEVGHAVGSAAREIGQGAKQVGKAIGKEAKVVGKTIGHAAKEGGKEFHRAVTGKSAKKDD